MEQRFRNGSFICPLAVTKVAGHGTQMDKFTIDEAFSLDDETGKLILDGMAPTMNTRLHFTGVQPQIWITSTEGTADSTFLNGLLDSFRAGNVPTRTCWFDFGIPDDADPEDFQTILKWHPAAGLLWDIHQLRDFREQFAGNEAGWADLRQPARHRRGRTRHTRPAVAIHVGHAGHTGSDRRPTSGDSRRRGRGRHEHVSLRRNRQHGRHRDRAIARSPGRHRHGTRRDHENLRHLPRSLVMDCKGPNADLHDRLASMTDEAGDPLIDFIAMQSSDYLAVGQAFVSGLRNRLVRHACDTELDASAASCARTWSGDAWRVTRRGSTGLTSPIESCMLAAWERITCHLTARCKSSDVSPSVTVCHRLSLNVTVFWP